MTDNIQDELQSLATIENATAYAAETDQYLFASYLIEAAGFKATNRRVEWLEDAFDILNQNQS